MIKIGIECENLEDSKSRWGIGHMVLNLLKEYEKNPEWQSKYSLYLYFNKFIPNDEVLKNPVFIKKVIGSKIFNSFNIFYHLFLPLKAMLDGVNFMFFPAYMMPPLYFGKAIVLLTNDVYHEYKDGSLPFRYKLAYQLFTNWAAIFAHKILTISNYSKNEVARLYNINEKRIFVSKLGVDLSHENYPGRIVNGEYLLYVGQMFPRRHARENILAFEKIAPDIPSLKFVLVGRDKYPDMPINGLILKINKSLGENRIIYHDYIESDDDIRSLYAHAELFIYVSDHEAFGLPPVEAASYKVPVIISDNKLGHEIFRNFAFYIKSGQNINEMAEVIKEAIYDQEKRDYFKANYPAIIRELSWNNFAKNFFDNIN